MALHPPEPVFCRSKADKQRVLHRCEKLVGELTFGSTGYKRPSLLWMSQQKDPSREPLPPLKSSDDSGLLACKTAFLVASGTWLIHLSAFTSDDDRQEHVKVARGYRMRRVGTWDITEGSKVSISQMCGF